MLRQFSKELEEDREFEFGGQVFRFRYPTAQELVLMLDKAVADAKGNGNPDEISFKADLAELVRNTLPYIEDVDDAHKRFNGLAKSGPPRFQFVELFRWLVEVTGGYPTNPSSPSSPGDESSPPLSSEKSPSQAATRKA